MNRMAQRVKLRVSSTKDECYKRFYLSDGRIFLEDFSPLYKQASDFLKAIAKPFLSGVFYAPAIEGYGVSRVMDSNNLDFKAGDLVSGLTNWEEYSVIKNTGQLKKLQKYDDIPLSYYLGLLGSPGFTAYAGVYKVCAPKKGDNVYVSAASSAVGQLVGQLANLGASTAGKMGGSEGLINPDLEMELKPQAQPRPYQEESLSRMFGNGRARSGIIWANQFKLWSNIPDERIGQFTYDSKKRFCGDAGVVVTTYSMLAFGGFGSQVHVVPAPMVRKVISVAKSHCKLGLTATLVREDEKITDLNVLIGPKLYEANRVDLVRGGYIENVQCAEVRCPMTKEFFAEYPKKENFEKKKQERGDKIIVLSDNIFALKKYAKKLHKPMVHRGISLFDVRFATAVNMLVPWSNERPLENKELNAIIGAWFTLWRD
ncbi:DNA repair helicase XPB1 [Tanacetum coccineum]